MFSKCHSYLDLNERWCATMMPHSLNHLFSGFCLGRCAAEGDWDLTDYSRSRAFAWPGGQKGIIYF